MTANNKPLVPNSDPMQGPPATGVVMIYATFPDEEAALQVGRDMVEKGLAACVNVLPAMTSVYLWKGETETAEEVIFIAKLAAEGADRAVSFILANHPYDTPAVLVLPVIAGSASYLDWVRSGTRL